MKEETKKIEERKRKEIQKVKQDQEEKMQAEEETKKIEGKKEGKPIGLYPKGGLMVINSDILSDKGTGNCVENLNERCMQG